jgi:hypothetical protein
VLFKLAVIEFFAFIDETTAKRYRLCLVAIPIENLSETRKAMQSLRLKGQSRIHMTKESDTRRRKILDEILRLESWNCLILEAKTLGLTASEARKKLLLVASAHKIWPSIKRLVIEDSTQRDSDKSMLTWIKNNSGHELSFDFCKPSSEECLWIADALGWAYAKGGTWRKGIKSRIQLVSSP